MKFTLLLSCFLFSFLSLSAQDDFNEDRYCVSNLRLYDFNTAKKLSHKEALSLIEPYPVAHSRYAKSIKQRNLAFISVGVFVGISAYVATNDDLKNNSFGDYNTFQKAIFVGFSASVISFIACSYLSETNRRRSLTEINKILKVNDSSYYDNPSPEEAIFRLYITPISVGVGLNF